MCVSPCKNYVPHLPVLFPFIQGQHCTVEECARGCNVAASEEGPLKGASIELASLESVGALCWWHSQPQSLLAEPFRLERSPYFAAAPPCFSLPAVCQLSVSACSGASTSPRAAVESPSSWELTCRCHSPSAAGLGFQRNLAVDPPLHKGTWETQICGLWAPGWQWPAL